MSADICRWLFSIILFFLWTAHTHAKDIRVVCYYTNWSVYRPGIAKFSPQNINPYLCTHLIYAFGGFTKENTLKPFDKYQDIEKGGYAKFTGLKTYNKELKTMLAIGGWNEGSSRFSPMVANAERRKELVKNAIKFLRQNHFDGLDLDWEYPSFRDGGKPRDRENYAKLVQELREEFERESEKTGRPRLLLTMAVPAGIEYINKGYDVPKLTKYLDWMNILSYDYHSAFEPSVNHHAPLYSLEEASEYNYDSELNIDYTIKHYLELGAEPDKLVLGIPTYGRSYTLFNPDANEVGAPADGPGEMGEATRENGYLAYYEICENIKSNNWVVVNENEKAMGPYAYKENQWVGYDDENIARRKSEYVAKMGLGGIMFWAIDNDDFRGTCHGKPYPLIEAAKEALLAASGITDDNLVSPPKKPTKPKNRTRSRPKVTENTDDDETTPKPVTKSNTRRRNRVKSKVTETAEESNLKPRRKEPRKSEISSTHSSLKVVTPSYTTPAPPATPDGGGSGGGFKCEDEGFFANPKDCKKYFWCLSGPGELGIVAHAFTCPAGLYFNKAADSCDYSQNVLCNKKLAKATTTTTTETSSSSTTKASVFSTTRAPPKITAATSKTTFKQTTTTEAYDDEYIYDDEDETENENTESEDPKVIKELLDLIKKAGGIEELEKQLKHTENNHASGATTPSSKTKNLVQKFLNNRNTKSTTKSTTEAIQRSKNSYSTVNRNSRGPQNAGIESDDKKTADRGRPQYTSIARSRTNKANDAEEDQPKDKDEAETSSKKNPEYVSIRRNRFSKNSESTNTDESDVRNKILGEDIVSSSEEDEASQPTSQSTPSYVNIRRQRPSTTAVEDDKTTSKYTLLKRGTTTSTAATTVAEGVSSNEPTSSRYKFLRRTTTTSAPSLESSGATSTRGKIEEQTSTLGITVYDSDPSTLRYQIISRGTTEDATNTKPVIETTEPITTLNPTISISSDETLLSTLSAIDSDKLFSSSVSPQVINTERLTTLTEKTPTTPQLLDPRPFSFSTLDDTDEGTLRPITISTYGPSSTFRPTFGVSSTTKVSDQKSTALHETSGTKTNLQARRRGPTRFNVQNFLKESSPAVNSKERRISTTEDSVRNYRPLDIGDLSSLTSVDIDNKDVVSTNRGRFRGRLTTTGVSTTTEAIKPRRILPKRKYQTVSKDVEVKDQSKSNTDEAPLTKRIRTSNPRITLESAPSFRPRKVIRKFTTASPDVNPVRESVARSPSNYLNYNRGRPFSKSSLATELYSTTPSTNDLQQNNLDESNEENENIKLSESNIRENNNINNIRDDSVRKINRKNVYRTKEQGPTEPPIVVRTRKIVRKLKPTEATTQDVETTTRGRRKIIRRLRPTTKEIIRGSTHEFETTKASTTASTTEAILTTVDVTTATSFETVEPDTRTTLSYEGVFSTISEVGTTEATPTETFSNDIDNEVTTFPSSTETNIFSTTNSFLESKTTTEPEENTVVADDLTTTLSTTIENNVDSKTTASTTETSQTKKTFLRPLKTRLRPTIPRRTTPLADVTSPKPTSTRRRIYRPSSTTTEGTVDASSPKSKFNRNKYRLRTTEKPQTENDVEEPENNEPIEENEEKPTSKTFGKTTPRSFVRKASSKPKFGRTTETTVTEKPVEVPNKINKSLYSKKRKMNIPVLNTATESITTDGTTISTKTDDSTSETLTTLLHVFAEPENKETTTEIMNDTIAITSSKTVEKLVEVNRIVEIHSNNSNHSDDEQPMEARLGAINRVTSINVVDGNSTNVIADSEVAKVQEITLTDLKNLGVQTVTENSLDNSSREDRKFEIYGESKVVDYNEKKQLNSLSNDKAEDLKPIIIDGKSHINIITPRPQSDRSTIALEGLFNPEPSTEKVSITTSEAELLEAEHSRIVDIRILEQDNKTSRSEKQIPDDKTKIIPIRVLHDDEEVQEARVVEISAKSMPTNIKIVPIQVAMARQILESPIVGLDNVNSKISNTPFVSNVEMKIQKINETL